MISNYKMPPEWHPHSATQMHWPSNRETWPGERLQRVEKVYLDIIEILHRYEPIHLFVQSRDVKDRAIRLMQNGSIDLSHITIHEYSVNDNWARDCGPIFVRDIDTGKYLITDWEYNAWGGKYPPYEDDNRLPKYVASKYSIKRLEPGMVLEGGSIETNGQGLFLSTRSVLLNENRNPELSRQEIEQRLQTYLGAEKIIWLNKGLAGDDTDGHIDDLSRFLDPSTILTMICEDPDDINYGRLQENLSILKKATDLQGNPLSIETLPLPKTKIDGATVDGSEYVPASYANFYIANGVVLVPFYDKQYDQKAQNLLERYFPDRDVIGIPCADLVWGQGSIHCITQQWYAID